MMNKTLLGLLFVILVGLVWEGTPTQTLSNVTTAMRRIENPFLGPVILKQSRSLIDYSLLDKMRRRKA